MPDVHAKLGPSGAKKWLTCTPSIVLEAQFPDSTSTFAEEGTAAHSLSELKLKLETEKIHPDIYKERYAKFKKENSYYTQSMNEYTDDYVDLVMERYYAHVDTSKVSVHIGLEETVNFSSWVPEGFGTSDVVICSDKTIEVIDLKYGKGVPVNAFENPQARLYALGAWDKYENMYDFENVRMTIVQPRLGSVTTDEMTVNDLLDWADNFVKPRAEMAAKGEGEFVPSEEACRFCKARGVCKARADKNLEIAKYEFSEPKLLNEKDIASIISQASEIKKWLEQVQEYALDFVHNHGGSIPGYKVVEGRSNRVINDKEEVSELLEMLGYEEVFKPKEIKALGALEKTLGKHQFEELLGEFIIKPQGKPALVEESDKRPALSSVNSAIEDFS